MMKSDKSKTNPEKHHLRYPIYVFLAVFSIVFYLPKGGPIFKEVLLRDQRTAEKKITEDANGRTSQRWFSLYLC